MLEAKGPDRRAIVGSHFRLLRVEAHTLADDLLGVAVRTPDCERAFEAHRLGAVRVAFRGRLTAGLVEGFVADKVRGDVAAHVEALHFGGGGRRAPWVRLLQLGSSHQQELNCHHCGSMCRGRG